MRIVHRVDTDSVPRFRVWNTVNDSYVNEPMTREEILAHWDMEKRGPDAWFYRPLDEGRLAENEPMLEWWGPDGDPGEA